MSVSIVLGMQSNKVHLKTQAQFEIERLFWKSLPPMLLFSNWLRFLIHFLNTYFQVEVQMQATDCTDKKRAIKTGFQEQAWHSDAPSLRTPLVVPPLLAISN